MNHIEIKLLSKGYRKEVIAQINSDENIQRKAKSYKKNRMQQDDFYQYVAEHLQNILDPETVREMTVYATVNLQRRISKAEAGVYRQAPERSFFVNDQEIEELQDIYGTMGVNKVAAKANLAYKYQEQSFISIVPQGKELSAKVLQPHHLDAIPDPKDPEVAACYIVSNFDNTRRDRVRKDATNGDRSGYSQGQTYRDGNNQKIADADDPIGADDRYYFWTPTLNFVCDGNGNVLEKDSGLELSVQDFEELDVNLVSPLADYQIMPIVEVAGEKDLEFWNRSGDTLFRATVLLNALMSQENLVVSLQGFAQAFYKGPKESMPESMRVGPTRVLFLPTDIGQDNTEFGFANPGSDLAGIREFRESMLASFLSSRGLDVKMVNGKGEQDKASSGIERLLKMIEKFEASQEDFSLFKKVEEQIFKVVCAWTKVYFGQRENGELLLNEKYQVNLPDIEDIDFSIEFSRPQALRSEIEDLELLEKEIEMGLSSRVHALMEYKDMTYDQALERIKEIDEFERATMPQPLMTEAVENEDDNEEVEEDEDASDISETGQA